MSESASGVPSSGRTQLDLLKAQLAAVDAWNLARRAAEEESQDGVLTREMRLDLSRRMEARRREHLAVVARAEQHLREAGGALSAQAPRRAVLAHRNAWLRDTVAATLEDLGVDVVGAFEDGADAAGTVVVEQPDLVLVEDRLPTVSGLELVQRIRAFSPSTVIGVQCLDEAGVPVFVQAGAAPVFTRRVPPVQIAQELVGTLSGEAPPSAG